MYSPSNASSYARRVGCSSPHPSQCIKPYVETKDDNAAGYGCLRLPAEGAQVGLSERHGLNAKSPNAPIVFAVPIVFVWFVFVSLLLLMLPLQCSAGAQVKPRLGKFC